MTSLLEDSTLRKVEASGEILNGLIRLSLREGSGFLWQKGEKGRSLWPVRVGAIDVDNKKIHVNLDHDLAIPGSGEEICLDFEQIDPRKVLFFKGDEKDILFKCEPGSFLIHDDALKLPIPETIFLTESRVFQRIIPIEPTVLNFTTHPTEKDYIHVSLFCQNISRGGLGAYSGVGKGKAHIFEKGDSLYLEKIGDHSLQSPRPVTVTSKRQVQEKGRPTMQFGFGFKEVISQEELDQLLRYFGETRLQENS